MVRVRKPDAVKELIAQKMSATPPAPTTFKAIGYVEKAGGQVEAIILQENQIQVVHIGDLIAGRYRVTKVSPDLVDTTDETLAQSLPAKPDFAESSASSRNGVRKMGVKVFAREFAPPCLVKDCYARPIADADKTSLGKIARQLKAQRANQREPLWVITNDNLAARLEEASRFGVGWKDMSSADSAEFTASTDRHAPNPFRAFASVVPGVLAVAGKGHQVASGQGVEPVSATLAAVSPAQLAARSSSSRENRIALPQSPKPGTDSLGFVQMANGTLETVVAEGEYTVRLVPGTPAVAMAQVTAPSDARGTPSAAVVNAAKPLTSSVTKSLGTDALGPSKHPVELAVGSVGQSVEMKPLGFVVKRNGEFSAIVSEDDEGYVVREGDQFAGRYRALAVSANAVKAVDEAPRQAVPPLLGAPPALPDLLSASVQMNLPPSPRQVLPTRTLKGAKGTHPVGNRVPDNHTQFIFQTLGYVEARDGQIQAVVADGSETYLVKQGDTFADRYRATSVDPILVLAVKVSAGQSARNSLSARKEFGEFASNKLYGSLRLPHVNWAKGRSAAGASGNPVLTDLGAALLNSPLTGLDLQPTFLTGQ
jgi:Tfp pilus assembly protein PilP